MTDDRILMELALKRGLLQPRQMREALAEQRRTGRRLSSILVRKGYLSRRQIRELAGMAEAAARKTVRLAGDRSRRPPSGLPGEVRSVARRKDLDIGRYVLVRRLGRGGMGEVWKAWAKDLRRFVAVKFIHHGTEEDRRRLLREARVSARLEHPDIVPIYEVGRSPKGDFIAMRYVDGETLDRTELNLVQKLQAVRDAARAIQYAHTQGVVHRDIKPQNILVEAAEPVSATDRRSTRKTGKGVKIYVTDFGLAKQQSVETSLSATGMIVGTPEYMAPEQARGKTGEVDERSDVYALGATLYRLVTGVPPFQGDSPMSVLNRMLREEPVRPTKLVRGLPREVETIVLKCLEKEKHRRYSSAAELADDLQRLLDGEPIRAKPAGLFYRFRKFAVRHKAVVALAGLLVVLAGYFLFLMLWPGFAEVRSTPGGAVIFVDGVEVGARTPATVRLWPPGRHLISVRLEGHEAEPVVVDAAAGRTAPVEVFLAKTYGFLSVVSDPAGAEVRLYGGDGERFLGRTPLAHVRVRKGGYRIVLRKPAYQVVSDHLDVRADARVRVEKRLSPVTGRLTLEGNVPGMWVRIEGEDPDRFGVRSVPMPLRDYPLPTGTYRLRFEAPNCFPRERSVRILPDRTSPGRVTLESMLVWTAGLDEEVWDPPFIVDLNRDAALDVLVQTDSGTVRAVSGREGSTMWETALGNRGHAPPVAADLNGDGDPDCVLVPEMTKIVVLSGADGSKLWEHRAPWELARAPAHLADLDNDGTLDCVFAGLEARILVLSGRDGRLLWKAEPEPGSRALVVSACRDVDGDSHPDVLAGSAGGKMFALSGKDGSVLWSFPLPRWVETPIRYADVDGDGEGDFVLYRGFGEVMAISGRTRTLLWSVVTSSPVMGPPALGDVDGDGDPDCVVALEGSAAVALRGKTGARLWRFEMGWGSVLPPVLGDFDGDGAADCILATEDGRVFGVSGRTGRTAWTFRSGDTIRVPPALVDLDGDGRLDCILAAGLRLVVFSTRQGPLEWEAPVGAPIVDHVAVAELDGDGRPDVALGTFAGELVALSGKDGRRLWTHLLRTRAGAAPVPGDFDGDGDSDWAVVLVKGGLEIIRGRDGRTLWHKKLPDSAEPAKPCADLNGDGLDDVVLALQNGGVRAYSGNGGRRLWSRSLPGRAVVTVGDVTGDRRPECVCVVEAEQVEVQALSGQDGSVLWKRRVGRGRAVRPGLGDVNGDGVPDVLLGYVGSRVFALSGGDGSVLWSAARDEGAPGMPAVAGGTGENPPKVFCGTSRTPIQAFRGTDGARLWTFWIRGLVRQDPRIVRFEEEPAPEHESVAVGDVDGDGTVDVLVCSRRGTLYAVSGETGRAMQVVQGAGTLRPIFLNERRRSAITVDPEGTVRKFALGPRRPSMEHGGRARSAVPSGLVEAQLALRRARWAEPGGAGIARLCERLSDHASRALRVTLRMIALRELVEERDMDGARRFLGALERDRFDSYAFHAYRFLVEPSPASFLRALERDPERSVDLLKRHAMAWRDGSWAVEEALQELLSRRAGDPLLHRARAASFMLIGEVDLALEEIEAARCMGARPENLRRLEQMLDEFPHGYLSRARRLASQGMHGRAVALARMALARADGRLYGEAARLAATSLKALGRSAEAVEVLKRSLRRPDLPEHERRAVLRMLGEIEDREF